MLCMLLYLYGEWKLTGFFSIVVHHMLKKKKLIFFIHQMLKTKNPRRRLRLCPRANKNLHIPAGYAQSILLHNICLQGDMQIFICFQAMPRAFPQHPDP
ncbi:hypothetical protein T01_14187 [Trichinella spiralis]|uniref:Uncharacterized protein n=1 Tax=Trichinella spiralis TaxID=6334 RepID=A0A0V1BIG1_TRISP|nr:hypothetical protein T01_14187 [Trichinella spiralis]